MPRKTRNELLFYYVITLLFIAFAIYSFIAHKNTDHSSLPFPIIVMVFTIINTYYRYYTSENEPGHNLPKYKFPYHVRRRWSFIHYITALCYGVFIFAVCLLIRSIIGSIFMNSVFLIIGLIVIGYSLRGLYRLIKEKEVVE